MPPWPTEQQRSLFIELPGPSLARTYAIIKLGTFSPYVSSPNPSTNSRQTFYQPEGDLVPSVQRWCVRKHKSCRKDVHSGVHFGTRKQIGAERDLQNVVVTWTEQRSRALPMFSTFEASTRTHRPTDAHTHAQLTRAHTRIFYFFPAPRTSRLHWLHWPACLPACPPRGAAGLPARWVSVAALTYSTFGVKCSFTQELQRTRRPLSQSSCS